MVKIEFDNTGLNAMDSVGVARILTQLIGIVLNIPGDHERHVCSSEGKFIGKMTVDDKPPE